MTDYETFIECPHCGESHAKSPLHPPAQCDECKKLIREVSFR